MGSSHGRLRQAQVCTGRCNLPCGLRDSRLRADRAPEEHRCVLDWGHSGPCDFIGTCRMDLRKSGLPLVEPSSGTAEAVA